MFDNKTTTKHFSATAAAMLFAATLAFTYLPKASADDWDHKTVITFGEVVQIPGQALPAGTYVFKTMRNTGDEHVVQIFDKNEQHLFATLLAIPVYRDAYSYHRDEPAIRFEERLSTEPQAVKIWFRPGDDIGQEFIYSKNQSQLLAMNSAWAVQGTAQTEVAMAETPAPVPNEPAAVQTTPAEDNSAVTPTESEPTPAAEAPAAPSPSVEETPEATPDTTQDQSASTPSSDTNSTPTTLPKTGSELPLIGLLGSFSLALGAGISKLSKRSR
jgi:hypothetical protein